MSKTWKEKRAEQARKRRAKQKQQLKILQRKASKPGASFDSKNEYLAAMEKQKSLLEYDRKRAAARRKKLKDDIAKAIPRAIQDAQNIKEAKRHQKGKTKAAEKAIHWQQKSSNKQRKQQEGIKKAAERHKKRNKRWK